MRTINIISFFLLSGIYLFGQNNTPKDYLEFIQQEEINTGNELVALSIMLKNSDEKELSEQLLKLRNTINASIERIDEVDYYHKSKYLKEAAIDYFDALRHLSKDDFKILIEIISKDYLTENDKEKANSYFLKVKNHIDEAYSNLNEAKIKFAEKHQLTIQLNPFKFYLSETKH
jgi:hypothetical protein